MQKIRERKMLNLTCEQKEIASQIINGCNKGLADPNNTKYPVFYKLYDIMLSCNWVPEEVDVSRDKTDFEKLLPAEKRAYGLVLSQLIFMDSLQTENTAEHVIPFISDPVAEMAFSRQAFDESLHSKSYYVMADGIYDDSNEIYNMMFEDKILQKKNMYLDEIYEKYGERAIEFDTTLVRRCKKEWYIKSKVKSNEELKKIIEIEEDFNDLLESNSLDEYIEKQFQRRFEAQVKMIIANQALEGIYFYSGFVLIYLFGRQGKMLGSVDMIRFIHRDELNHTALFANLFRIVHQENKNKFSKKLYEECRQILVDAAELEIEWGQYVTQNQIVGINNELIEKYIKYLANDRFRILGLDRVNGLPLPFEGYYENPLKWVDNYRKLNDTKTAFFESTNKNYDNAGTDLSAPIKSKDPEVLLEKIIEELKGN